MDEVKAHYPSRSLSPTFPFRKHNHDVTPTLRTWLLPPSSRALAAIAALLLWCAWPFAVSSPPFLVYLCSYMLSISRFHFCLQMLIRSIVNVPRFCIYMHAQLVVSLLLLASHLLEAAFQARRQLNRTRTHVQLT